MLLGERFIHISDAAALAPWPDNPMTRTAVELTGPHTLLMVPLRKDSAFLG